eukprot:SAG11_NODE_6846_length_1237_cov_0.982425_1_plen_132_part_10
MPLPFAALPLRHCLVLPFPTFFSFPLTCSEDRELARAKQVRDQAAQKLRELENLGAAVPGQYDAAIEKATAALAQAEGEVAREERENAEAKAEMAREQREHEEARLAAQRERAEAEEAKEQADRERAQAEAA